MLMGATIPLYRKFQCLKLIYLFSENINDKTIGKGEFQDTP